MTNVWIRCSCVLSVAVALTALPAVARDEASDDVSDDSSAVELFERVRVTGSPDERAKIPGSATYLDQQTLDQQAYDDVHRVLSMVPGVIVQEEEGYGLRPNIGMRGTGSERSSKITTMEDGVLIAPAPYAAPSAYYFPTVARMEGVEVRKGSSSIENGPFTAGGVINFLSSSIPDEFDGRLDASIGSDDAVRGAFAVGDASERFGWLVETHRQQTDGFKRLDGGRDTGYELEDYLVKLRVTSASAARVFQALELKLGRTEQDADETYVGLTEADFAATPFRRYAGSQVDRLVSDHDQVVARYMVRPSQRVDVTAVLYRNDFFRNWSKLQSVLDASDGAYRSVGSALGDADTLAILRAQLSTDSADDALRVRNNRRDYFSQGLQAVVGVRLGARPGEGVSHELEIGARLHEDEEDRFQEEDGYKMTAGGTMALTSRGAPGSQSNRVSTGEATALFVRDTISAGRWTLTPGVRLESIEFGRTDYDDAARTIVGGTRSNRLDELIPGVGVSYELARGDVLFAGVHRGFTPPGPSAVDTDAETSTNVEFGWRRVRGALRGELVAFHNDYDSMLGACTVSSGCSTADVGDVFDSGDVRVRGVETSLSWNGVTAGGLAVPLSATYTWTDTEFLTSFESDYDPWGSVSAGDELPYVPRHQASLAAGLIGRDLSLQLNAIWVDGMRTVAGQGPRVDTRSTDAHLLVDLSGSVRLNDELRLYARVRNLTDEIYVAARRPAGARPGVDRTLLVGLTYDF